MKIEGPELHRPSTHCSNRQWIHPLAFLFLKEAPAKTHYLIITPTVRTPSSHQSSLRLTNWLTQLSKLVWATVNWSTLLRTIVCFVMLVYLTLPSHWLKKIYGKIPGVWDLGSISSCGSRLCICVGVKEKIASWGADSTDMISCDTWCRAPSLRWNTPRWSSESRFRLLPIS